MAKGYLQKECLAPDAEIPAAAVVLREELARRTETSDDPHVRCSRRPAAAEEFLGLVLFQVVVLVVLAVYAVLPADLPVLFRVVDHGLVGYDHGKTGLRSGLIDLAIF